MRARVATAVLTDDPNNQMVWDALPVIDKQLAAQAAGDEPVEPDEPAGDDGEGEDGEEDGEEDDDDDDADDDDDDEEDGEDGEEDGENEGEDEIEDEVDADGGLADATAGLAVDACEPAVVREEAFKDTMLRESLRNLVDSLVEDDGVNDEPSDRVR